MKVEPALWTIVERAKKGHALDVIPVKMGDKDVRAESTVSELSLQRVSEHTKAGAAVEDVNLVSDADFYAGGVASVAQILGLWSGRGAAHAPELNLHILANACQLKFDRDNLPVKMFTI